MPRVELKTTCFMNLDGQPQLVLSGSVIDVPGDNDIHPSVGVALAEAPANTRVAGKFVPQSVRSVRKR